MIYVITNLKFKKVSNKRKGFNAPNWKGGRFIDSHGYVNIYKPDHPFANKKGYVLEHRYVYEQFYNCILLPYVDIHHIDGNKLNNSINNLQPLYHSQHMSLNRKKKDMSNRSCFLCKSNTTYVDKRGYINWCKYKNMITCHVCYIRLKRYKNKHK